MDTHMETHSQNHLVISDEIRTFLLTTAKWCKIISIIGFVGIVLGLLFVIGFIFTLNSIGSNSGTLSGYESIFSGFFGFVNIILIGLYFLPIYYLYKFSEYIKKGLMLNDQQELELGFENLKKHYQFVGIMTLILLSLYALTIVIIMVVGVGSSI